MAIQGGKTDMERLGMFSEMGYVSLGDRYPKVSPGSRPFNEMAYKGKQMLPGGSKTRSALQAGYFDSGFKRIMEKEAYTDSIKNRRRTRIEQTKKNITTKPFLPSNFTKKATGKGNHFGTFGGAFESFSPVAHQRKNYITPGRNFTSNPGKKGTGYGYVGVTLGKYQDHAAEPYDRSVELRRNAIGEHKKKVKGGPFKLNLHPKTYFDVNPYKADRKMKENKKGPSPVSKHVIKTPFRPSNPGKKIAGCKSGTFETYPSHSVDPYQPRQKQSTSGKLLGGIFHPSACPKSTPTKSTLLQNVTRSINRNNFKNVRTVMAF